MKMLTPSWHGSYPPRRARASYVRPYLIAHERRVRERQAAEAALRDERLRALRASLAGAGAVR
ncbi:hypothetical protein LG943_10925 [Streptomonospora sp. S1-112]|uniref:Uncharacterized protein n=1 Tax=Streptomonospora mangrovi TaxID=2883123 RepID=A0A9X3NJE6_9ACTN|nr:hypothetical protein [Streptomonospora mangrovi]MDA0564832.1 hypothetical protein [Streptomonospora mangrovi]